MLSAFIAILALTGCVRGHGFITGIDGANGKVGIGFGVDAAQITVCGSCTWSAKANMSIHSPEIKVPHL
jgi:hypothetical protein